MANLKTKSHGHLSDARVYGIAADNAERSRREISVRVRKLRVVEGIEELSPQFNRAFSCGHARAMHSIGALKTSHQLKVGYTDQKNICYFSLIL